DAGRPFIAMELLEGIDLRRLLSLLGGRLTWPCATWFGAEIARALQAVHDGGIVHGDLSLSNVMACTDGAVKLLDFGLARPAGFEQTTSTLRGKLPYLPPESVLGTAPDSRADVYGLAVLLFELVTGELPYRGPNDLATMNQILHGAAPAPATFVTDLPPE